MKKIVLLLLCICSVFIVAGCSEKKEIDLEFEVLSPEDIKNEKINIKFLVRSGVVSKALTDVLVPEFNKEYPNINVTVEGLSGDYSDLKKTLLSDLNNMNSTVADMAIGYPDHFVEYFAGGNLINIQEFINDETVGYTQEELNDFVPSYLEENRNFDKENPNDLYGLPFNKSTEVLVYNKTFFKLMYGENYQTKLPKTWQELEALATEIREKVIDNKEADEFFIKSEDDKGNVEYLKISDYGDQFIPFGYDSSDNAFITMTRQFGGQYTKKESLTKGTVLYNNDQVIEGLSYFSRLKDNKLYAVAGTWGDKYCSNLFKKIQCVMTVGSSAGVNYNSCEKYEYDLGIANIPYYYDEDKAEDEQNKYVIQQGTNICILNQNTNKQRLACWLFTKFLLEPENSALFAMETGGYLPVRRSSYETDTYQLYLTEPSNDKISYSAAANVALDYLDNGYKFFTDPAFVGSSTVRDTVGTVFNTIITNKKSMSAEQIRNVLQDSYNQLGPSYLE